MALMGFEVFWVECSRWYAQVTSRVLMSEDLDFVEFSETAYALLSSSPYHRPRFPELWSILRTFPLASRPRIAVW